MTGRDHNERAWERFWLSVLPLAVLLSIEAGYVAAIDSNVLEFIACAVNAASGIVLWLSVLQRTGKSHDR